MRVKVINNFILLGMPSPRKRIGFLPRPVVQEMISEIANKEKLSQSRVVGILVEEALKARGIFASHISNEIKIKSTSNVNDKFNTSSYLHNDINELISDKGVTYNKSSIKNEITSKTNNSSIVEEEYDAELFKKFKEFIEFQKLMESQ